MNIVTAMQASATETANVEALASIQHAVEPIALNRLVPSKANVRRVNAAVGVSELADSIEAHGLIHNLTVRKAKKGRYEVIAGSRRLAALRLLAKEGRLAEDAEIPCNLREEGSDTEISLAENVQREVMHVVDEILAYRQLAEGGMAPETIAARFGQPVITVRQRLKLAHLSPKLLDVMRGDGLTIEQARALALSDSHEEQEGVWFGLPDWNREPRSIRAMLTQEHVRSTDRLARFVGLDAYEAAGGAVLRDLFAEDSGTFLTDRALLTQLAMDALEQAAVPLSAEGWKWVELALDTSAMFNSGHGRIYPQERALTEDGQAEPSAPAYDPQEMALAGCIVAVDHGGALHIGRGYVKAEDRDAAEGLDDGEGEEVEPVVAAPDAGYSAALVEELTAIRTAAMRVELANRPAVALAALLYPLVSRIFHDAYLSYGTAFAVEVSGQRRDLAGSIKESGEVRALAAWEAMKEAWGEQLPGASADLWTWLLEQPMDRLVDLLAFVTAANLNGVRTKHDQSGSRLANVEQIAVAVDLDMHRHWEPQAAFLSRLSKGQIAEVLIEAGCTPQVVRAVEKAPKAEAVAEAEKLLEGTGWLPALLQGAAAA
ncbi:ParB/RepB/Spo0J family partition protein [Agrobacterium leguminum]|uniref:ParB/RepB/Spo0J family partition protein n=1 Tax=Agrobacterium leguminum TaxID=2792015 RepID=UPI0022B81F9E|nr:ParB/RepB/Spo0J family partition protein [Agrobacterium leguminum]MCZ7935720.1 ParB/RepB/Spo0J family partition protein [Agrobacterium leguminum]